MIDCLLQQLSFRNEKLKYTRNFGLSTIMRFPNHNQKKHLLLSLDFPLKLIYCLFIESNFLSSLKFHLL